jgi:DNA-binding MarR family transcriptional regulator
MKSAKSRDGGGWKDPLGEAEYKALGDFRRAVREFLQFSAEGADEFEISAQQHQALLAIRAHTGPEPISVGELADCLLIKHHSAVGLVDRMVERGIVARIESLADKRRVLLELTPEGRRMLSEISVRNLGRLHETSRTLGGISRTVRRLERRGLWTPKSGAG